MSAESFIRLTVPFDAARARELHAGDMVLLSGTIWTARDAAHKRLVELLDAGEKLPVALQNQTIYFAGPCPPPPGFPIGSAGPTTSARMDAYSPRLIAECGLTGMIGKGDRSPSVIEAMKRCGAVYFAATGGAGALIAQSITACETVAFPDLGTEAIHRLTVQELPVLVVIDAEGNDLYQR